MRGILQRAFKHACPRFRAGIAHGAILPWESHSDKLMRDPVDGGAGVLEILDERGGPCAEGGAAVRRARQRGVGAGGGVIMRVNAHRSALFKTKAARDDHELRGVIRVNQP